MLLIRWWKELSWEVEVSGSKNATLPILGACLLLRWKVKLMWVPKIWDVNVFLDILEGMWVKYSFDENNLTLDTTNLNQDDLDFEKIKQIRSSIFLLSPLLHFFGNINIPFPWWCSIWKRPIDAHLNWLERIWYKSNFDWENIEIKGKLAWWTKTLNAWFWVSSTENLIVANVLRIWKTIIKASAIEPHVMNLVTFLRKAGANIKIRYNHEIIIEWVSNLNDNFEFEIVGDYIESGTYMIIAALASKEYLDIKRAQIEDLYFFIEKLKEAWVKVKNLWNDILRVFRAKKLKWLSFQTNIFPGFPTDLQSPFSVLMTQAEWISKIHEVLFEGRLNFLVELEKMKANVAILNPHEALIFWPTELEWWVTVTSWDLRAWAAMLIAWLITKWEINVTNVKYIYRWYEKIVEKLKNIWADIEEID